MTGTEYPETARTRASRSRERLSDDRETVHAVLDEALVCHVGFVVDGRPVVLPQLHARVGERLDLAEVSVKVRPPSDDPDDVSPPYWAGVLPISAVVGARVPAPDVPPGTAVPAHVGARSSDG